MKKGFIVCFVSILLLCAFLCACVLHRGDFAFTPSYDQGELTLTSYMGTDKNVTVPQSHWGMPVTGIGKNAFLSVPQIESVALPNTVKVLLSYSFANCPSLKTVALPDSLERIESIAFQNCSRLESIIIPKGVNYIGTNAFVGCTALKEFKVDAANAHFRAVDGHLYSQNTLLICAPASVNSEFSVADGTQRIESGAFTNCNILEIVYVPASVTFFASDAFFNSGAIREIRFLGTTEQWCAMSSQPDFGSRYVSIVCSNGTLSGGN